MLEAADFEILSAGFRGAVYARKPASSEEGADGLCHPFSPFGYADASTAAVKLPKRRRIVRSDGVIRAVIHELRVAMRPAVLLDELADSLESGQVSGVAGFSDLVRHRSKLGRVVLMP